MKNTYTIFCFLVLMGCSTASQKKEILAPAEPVVENIDGEHSPHLYGLDPKFKVSERRHFNCNHKDALDEFLSKNKKNNQRPTRKPFFSCKFNSQQKKRHQEDGPPIFFGPMILADRGGFDLREEFQAYEWTHLLDLGTGKKLGALEYTVEGNAWALPLFLVQPGCQGQEVLGFYLKKPHFSAWLDSFSYEHLSLKVKLAISRDTVADLKVSEKDTKEEVDYLIYEFLFEESQGSPSENLQCLKLKNGTPKILP